ncbi:transporter substrate-binding domain-containing protein [Neiella sp. HB171785]|uniref:Transporter substrate-binding domain-containing protein n=1 Tax=Neiella litorisoli TaxID=2771431 RepID=A0A8J6QUL9_9GAMM|nr:transporter substrate-binding domain-containing protein [Neiella litorisoli]MBD1391039.1 transporter substrate-binding domain-containing protein [Neiella litorisoli]
MAKVTYRMFLLCLMMLMHPPIAADSIMLYSPSWSSKNTLYKHEVVTKALDLTKQEYGSYTTKITDIDIKPKRIIALMQTGKLVNVAVFAANEMWDKSALPIRIPIRGGMLSYRLLLVNKNDLDKFSQVTSAEQLKALRPGVVNDWSTTGVLERGGFDVVQSQHFEGLFSMLSSGRIEYIPRGVYEIYTELENRRQKYPDVVIEPTLAIRIPMVTYVYVAPQERRLAQRIEKGLAKMVQNGELRRIFNKYYQQEFQLAQLHNRRIIEIESDYYMQLNGMESNLIWPLGDVQH